MCGYRSVPLQVLFVITITVIIIDENTQYELPKIPNSVKFTVYRGDSR